MPTRPRRNIRHGTGRTSEARTDQVRDRGGVTLPTSICKRFGLGTGDVLDVLDLDGVFVLSSRASVVPGLAAEIDRLRVEAGVTTEDVMAGLHAERERYARERYGRALVDALTVPGTQSESSGPGAPTPNVSAS